MKHPVDKLDSLILLVGGVLLMLIGINATNSLGSDVWWFFSSSSTNKAIWVLIGGIIASVVGLIGMMRGRKRP